MRSSRCWILITLVLVVSCNRLSSRAPSEAPLGVRTARDEVGSWFVFSVSPDAGFEAMGYAVAEDRLWQLELYRRIARGELAELFGPAFLQTDLLSRTLAYSDDELLASLGQLLPEARRAIDAYVEGIGRRMEEVRAGEALRPYEFEALGLDSTPWSATDVLAWLSEPWILQERWLERTLQLVFEDELEIGESTWRGQDPTLLFNVLLHGLSGEGLVNGYDWFRDRGGRGVPEDPQTSSSTLSTSRSPSWVRGRGHHPGVRSSTFTPCSDRSGTHPTHLARPTPTVSSLVRRGRAGFAASIPSDLRGSCWATTRACLGSGLTS